MGRIPKELREIIARNIRDCKVKMFPGRGGSKKCAEAFGISPQQLSPWERGMRTPDEDRMIALAKFFTVTVEWLRTDHSKPLEQEQSPEQLGESPGEKQSHESHEQPDPAAHSPSSLNTNTQSPPTLPPGISFTCPPCCPLLSRWSDSDKVTKKVGDAKFSIGPWFTIYFNDGSEFEVKNITQISEADVVVEGIIAFIRAYKGQASVILRTDNRKAFEHLATPIASSRKWNLKVDQSVREEFEHYRDSVGIAYEYPSVVSKTIKVYRLKAKPEKE